ncbi:hypothetical protein DPMN_103314 [Dreissena polymorpha]|uniref:Uncharacterized protein n=1 Tax=Dreissena polymorpha TaxID=45954 RepID=A0A9D4K2B9_DREPO|nr:hypothetical protein DPMN_103314 [Dreissena polymorpha]
MDLLMCSLRRKDVAPLRPSLDSFPFHYVFAVKEAGDQTTLRPSCEPCWLPALCKQSIGILSKTILFSRSQKIKVEVA